VVVPRLAAGVSAEGPAPMDMDQWDDLLLTGGFAPRAVLLRNLTLAQAGAVPPGAPHSIYQELWHAARVLDMSLTDGRVVLETWPLSEHFPASAQPANQAEWDALVKLFLAASEKAVKMSHEPGWLESQEPGYGTTWRDS